VARVLVRQGGTARPDRPNTPIQLALGNDNRRPVIRAYLRDVVGRDDAIRGGEDAAVTYLDARAAELLGVPPALGEALPGRSTVE
jgi:hypothetical protein